MENKIKSVHGITYIKPKVTLMQDTGIGTSEYAARTAYDSFEASENPVVILANRTRESNKDIPQHIKDELNDIEESSLLDNLAWTYFHHSVLEHASMTYLVEGISRGVLQELARHRIASYTVRSTRYTMGSVLNAFNASFKHDTPLTWFMSEVDKLNLLNVDTLWFKETEYETMWNKLLKQMMAIGRDNFRRLSIAKSSLHFMEEDEDADTLYYHLENGKAKRNVGDPFKHIVSDNWNVDLVMTMNLRSMKNFLDLRDSGSAWFQIRWLAEEMKEVTPHKYLKLISKKEVNK